MSSISGGLVHGIPLDLANVLTHAKGTLALWENLTPIARNEFICWIEDAKQEKLERSGFIGLLRSFLKVRSGHVVGWAAFIALTKSPANGSKRF